MKSRTFWITTPRMAATCMAGTRHYSLSAYAVVGLAGISYSSWPSGDPHVVPAVQSTGQVRVEETVLGADVVFEA